MKQQTFEDRRRVSWLAFESSVKAARRGYRLQAAEPSDFVAEYRNVARDLSVAKSRGYSRRLVAYLNDLTVRGHNLLYVRRSGWLGAVRAFVTGGFPGSVRAHWPYVLCALIVFGASLALMAVTVILNPDWIYTVLDPMQAAGVEAMYDPEARVLGRERASDGDFRMFGFYIMNNIGIAFQMFAGGLLLGVGTLFYLLFNGVFIGAVTGHLINVGFTETFATFVVGHGAFELTGIVLAGAGGLMIGHALLDPGPLRRVDALQQAARGAVRLVAGAALLLVAAAFVEAFWSSINGVAPIAKYLVGAALWTLVLGYLAAAGNPREGN